MALKRITDADTAGKWIRGLDDTPDLGTDGMQDAFDAVSHVVITLFNSLVDELAGMGGASTIGAAVAGMAGENVQTLLTAFKALSDNRYTKAESDALVGGNTSTLLANVALDNSGVWTFTRKDGSTVVYDTKLEKIVVNFKLDGDYLVLTHDDGTEERVSIAAFRDHHQFADSDAVSWSYSGDENNRTFTAKIKANSITLGMLSLDAVSKIEGDVTTSGQNAAAALASKNAAESAAAAALQSKTDAQTAKTAAEAAKTGADTSAAGAEASKQSAGAYASGAASDAQKAKDEAARAKREADRAASTAAGDFVTRPELAYHTGNKENPHGVTAAQIGAASGSNATAVKADGYYSLTLHDLPSKLPEIFHVSFTLPEDYVSGDKIRIEGVPHLVNLYGKGFLSNFPQRFTTTGVSVGRWEALADGYICITSPGGDVRLWSTEKTFGILKDSTSYLMVTEVPPQSTTAIGGFGAVSRVGAFEASIGVSHYGINKSIATTKADVSASENYSLFSFWHTTTVAGSYRKFRCMLLEDISYMNNDLPADYWEDTFGEYDLSSYAGSLTNGAIKKGQTITVTINTASSVAYISAEGMLSDKLSEAVKGIKEGFEEAKTAIEQAQEEIEGLKNRAVAAKFTATITANWTGSAAPFTQTVSVSGILASDVPRLFPAYSADLPTRRAQEEAFSMVSMANAAANSLTFTCFWDKPSIAIPITIEVIR